MFAGSRTFRCRIVSNELSLLAALLYTGNLIEQDWNDDVVDSTCISLLYLTQNCFMQNISCYCLVNSVHF